jgi:hypothetical protein
MGIAPSGPFVFYGQWPMALFVPLFLFIGRSSVGAEVGWLGLIGLAYGWSMILLLLVPAVLTLFDRVVRRERATRMGYDIATALLWLVLIVAAIAVPDSSDSGHLDSALTVWTGGDVTRTASTVVFAVALAGAVIAYLAALVFAVRGIIASRHAAAGEGRGRRA